jgi:predicted acylesterase/phospholipase RssA
MTIEEEKQLISKAKTYLHGQVMPENAVYKLGQQLETIRNYELARRVFSRLHHERPHDQDLLRKVAVCTYKDDRLPGDQRFDMATNLISMHIGDDAEKITNYKALGALGAINKRKWIYNNQIQNLRKSLDYYFQGHLLWVKDCNDGGHTLTDNGYCGINAAYICDILSAKASESTKNPQNPLFNVATNLRERADKIRTEICNYSKTLNLEEKAFNLDFDENPTMAKYWIYVTWAESLLGLGQFDEAKEKLKLASKCFTNSNWQVETTTIQLSELVELRFSKDKKALTAAQEAILCLSPDLSVFKNIENSLIHSLNTKVGLALSGGGFRAAIYHIGVLAKLAELNLLKEVQVISCVSGGSIIGAYYYLKVKKLLEEKTDSEITQEDYLKIVAEIEKEFIKDINTNLRLRILSNFMSNLKMAVSKRFTRTSRLAQLYESQLYHKLLAKEDGNPVYMHDLLIKIKGDLEFNIQRDNWKRNHKIPSLIINATTLNTGHCWQFTAKSMGEPTGDINKELDARPTLRKVPYDDAPGEYKRINLATAVSASSCVPGLFAPVEFPNLYEDGITVELVDGGVHDNQGVNTLLDKECNYLIVSDACGQMASIEDPKANIFGVINRTNVILQERVRNCQLLDLESRKSSGLLQGFMLMHLTKDLPSKLVNWINCDDLHYSESIQMDTEKGNVLTDYGIRKSVQERLARIRTDLDAFHETEANALMYSGYATTAFEHSYGKNNCYKTTVDKNKDFNAESQWSFFNIKPQIEKPEPSRQIEKILDASSSLFFKINQLNGVVRWVTYLGAALLFVLGGVLFLQLLPIKVWVVLGIITLVLLVDSFLPRKKRFGMTLFGYVVSLPLVPFAWLFFYVVLVFFNNLYLKLGKIRG